MARTPYSYVGLIMTIGTPDDAIELRVDEIAQLFHTLDPFPFRERDLDREAEEFIVGWARELPVDQPIKIIVHFPENEVQSKAAQDLAEAFRRYFSYRATVLQRDLTELFRIGRRSLGIGWSYGSRVLQWLISQADLSTGRSAG
jgi:hypothetical protein